MSPVITASKFNIEKKTSIASYAVSHFVGDNDIIILEAGTTVGTMIKFFNCHNLTVITNGLANLEDLSMCVPDVTVLSCGGMLRDVANTFVGPQAVDFFRGVRARTFFLSGSGLAMPDGITDPNLFEIQIKRAMADSVGQVILLMDSSKFGVRSLSPILPLERIKILVTDAGAPESDVRQLQAAGVEVHIAP
jgi:DeoR/GlpR family transcriptional regulator of sugar metabolism